MTMNKQNLGDFQTPLELASQVLARLYRDGVRYERVLEPTCGRGHFIQAILQLNRPPSEIIGIEWQDHYVALARQIRTSDVALRIYQANIFDLDGGRELQWDNEGPLLIVGNPPWVTNAAQGATQGDNLPLKENFKQLKGLDALTGKSNFDIAEYILLKLIDAHRREKVSVTLAFLVKTSVARQVLRFVHDRRIPVSQPRFYRIDAKRWFKATVEAGLLVLTLQSDIYDYDLALYDSLDADEPVQHNGFVGQELVADVASYRSTAYLEGQSPLTWRQGLKHDAASVMELRWQGTHWLNGLGEAVEIEPDYLYPLLKGSDLQIEHDKRPRRAVVVTQRALGQETHHLRQMAPALWGYLNLHRERFEGRRSSIYRGKPAFSIFGVGDYSFAPYKILVSGFYKRPRFVPVGPVDQKAVFVDDTCYLLPLKTPEQAALLAAGLNHPLAQAFLQSLIFVDGKRPLTKALLSRLDLSVLIDELPMDEWLSRAAWYAESELDSTLRLRADRSEIKRLLLPQQQLPLF